MQKIRTIYPLVPIILVIVLVLGVLITQNDADYYVGVWHYNGADNSYNLFSLVIGALALMWILFFDKVGHRVLFIVGSMFFIVAAILAWSPCDLFCPSPYDMVHGIVGLYIYFIIYVLGEISFRTLIEKKYFRWLVRILILALIMFSIYKGFLLV